MPFTESIFRYPTRQDWTQTRSEMIEGLSMLDKAITKAEKNIERFTRLRSLPILESERIFYTNTELDEFIEHWTMTAKNMRKCFNSSLEELKIK